MWTSAVRLMRVDYQSPITEKARDDGYFLFNFPHQGREYSGSFELSRVRERGVDSVRVSIQIGKMPEYVELMVLDRLEKKLKEEFGPPRQPPVAKPPAKDAPASPDEGGDGKPPAEPGPHDAK